MSLDIDTTNKSGCITAGTFAAGLTAWPTTVQLDMTNDNEARVYIDTSGGDVTLTPVANPGLAEGDKMLFVKTTTDGNRIVFTDPDGVTYNFVDRQSEYICLKYDGTDWWVS